MHDTIAYDISLSDISFCSSVNKEHLVLNEVLSHKNGISFNKCISNDDHIDQSSLQDYVVTPTVDKYDINIDIDIERTVIVSDNVSHVNNHDIDSCIPSIPSIDCDDSVAYSLLSDYDKDTNEHLVLNEVLSHKNGISFNKCISNDDHIDQSSLQDYVVTPTVDKYDINIDIDIERTVIVSDNVSHVNNHDIESCIPSIPSIDCDDSVAYSLLSDYDKDTNEHLVLNEVLSHKNGISFNKCISNDDHIDQSSLQDYVVTPTVDKYDINIDIDIERTVIVSDNVSHVNNHDIESCIPSIPSIDCDDSVAYSLLSDYDKDTNEHLVLNEVLSHKNGISFNKCISNDDHIDQSSLQDYVVTPTVDKYDINIDIDIERTVIVSDNVSHVNNHDIDSCIPSIPSTDCDDSVAYSLFSDYDKDTNGISLNNDDTNFIDINHSFQCSLKPINNEYHVHGQSDHLMVIIKQRWAMAEICLFCISMLAASKISWRSFMLVCTWKIQI